MTGSCHSEVKSGTTVLIAMIILMLSTHWKWRPLQYENGYSVATTRIDLVSQRQTASDDISTYECTMAKCFDFQKCRQGLTIYMYPEDPFLQVDLERKPPYGAVELLKKVIRDRFKVVTKPEDACLFLNPYETSCEGNDCIIDNGNLSIALTELPFWNNGRNHIINFYGNDMATPPFSIGHAIILSASMRQASYRRGYDMMLPIINSGMKVESDQVSNRDLLLYFQGSIYGWEHCSARGKAFKALSSIIPNQPDVLLFGRCGPGWKRKDIDFSLPQYPELCQSCQTGGKYCNADTNWTEPPIDYRDGLKRSRYGLAPSGCGPLSYRLIEIIFSGGVPIQIGDDAILPYEGDDTEISRAWKRCVLFPAEANLSSIVDELRNMTSHEYTQRLHACSALVRAQQNELYYVLWLGLCDIASRIRRTVLTLDMQEECDQLTNLFRGF